MRGKDNLITFLQDEPSVHIYEGNLDASVCIVALWSKGISPLCSVSMVRRPWPLGGYFGGPG